MPATHTTVPQTTLTVCTARLTLSAGRRSEHYPRPAGHGALECAFCGVRMSR